MPSATFYNLPAEKRERLLRAAREEFSRVPYESASVNRIIRSAGIPRGSFYMYFTDKEELFGHLMDSYGALLERRMGEMLEQREGDLFAAFLDLFDHIQAHWGGREIPRDGGHTPLQPADAARGPAEPGGA